MLTVGPWAKIALQLITFTRFKVDAYNSNNRRFSRLLLRSTVKIN